jgi:hypothetical protein
VRMLRFAKTMSGGMLVRQKGRPPRSFGSFAQKVAKLFSAPVNFVPR